MMNVGLLVMLLSVAQTPSQQTPTGTLRVTVTSDAKPVAGADLRAGERKATTSAEGVATLTLPPGSVTLVVSREGFAERTVTATVTASVETAVAVKIEMQARPEHKEEVVVTATRADKRVQDEPLRVEVLGREEIEE